MRRSSLWLILLVALLGVLILREPRLQQEDDFFLGWFMDYSKPIVRPAPVTLVEISRDDFMKGATKPGESQSKDNRPKGRGISPLEYALFLQSVLEFNPAVIAIEPVLQWQDRDKDQEQVFIDQAMRVPKLLVGVELGEATDSEAPPEEVPTFWGAEGRRGALAEFSGIAHESDQDLHLISTPGFINAPGEQTDRVRVPLLFLYRGEVVPSFALQAIMLWLGATPSEVKVQLGKYIYLPNGWKIPIRRDGTVMVNPIAAKQVRRLAVTDILLAAQERDTGTKSSLDLDDLRNQIVLVRASDDPLQPPNIFATAIATIQNNTYVRRVSEVFDWMVIGVAIALSCFVWSISRFDLLFGAIGFSAGYLMATLAALSRYYLWLPVFLPLALLFCLVLARFFGPSGAQKIPATVSAQPAAP
jgi:CHASE2 domain